MSRNNRRKRIATHIYNLHVKGKFVKLFLTAETPGREYTVVRELIKFYDNSDHVYAGINNFISVQNGRKI